jgi:hypothetical protein
MKRVRGSTLVGITLVALAGAAVVSAEGAAILAYWAPHNEIDEPPQLTRPYDCDDLYYKYRDVLLKLGARGLKIYTYGCIRHGQAESGQPRVNLSYSVPRERPGGPGIPAQRKSVTLKPGDPKSLTSDDCALLNNMRQTVIAAIASKIDAHGLDCGSSGGQKHFELTVETLLPVEEGQ